MAVDAALYYGTSAGNDASYFQLPPSKYYRKLTQTFTIWENHWPSKVYQRGNREGTGTYSFSLLSLYFHAVRGIKNVFLLFIYIYKYRHKRYTPRLTTQIGWLMKGQLIKKNLKIVNAYNFLHEITHFSSFRISRNKPNHSTMLKENQIFSLEVKINFHVCKNIYYNHLLTEQLLFDVATLRNH